MLRNWYVSRSEVSNEEGGKKLMSIADFTRNLLNARENVILGENITASRKSFA